MSGLGVVLLTNLNSVDMLMNNFTGILLFEGGYIVCVLIRFGMI